VARKPTDTVQLKLRFSESLRRRLEREAKREERSLNAEIVGRLDESFQKAREADLTADTFRAALGGPTGDLLRACATAIWLLEKRTAKKWNEDLETAFQVKHALSAICDAFIHPLDADTAFHFFKETRQPVFLGKGIDISGPANAAALEALQKMGLAPSDEEIAKAAKKHDDAKAEGAGQ
jgi:Arc-like DNA binding domain